MSIYHKLAQITGSHPIVYCSTCQRSEWADAAQSFQSGWPECCGYTMTLDKPKDQPNDPR